MIFPPIEFPIVEDADLRLVHWRLSRHWRIAQAAAQLGKIWWDAKATRRFNLLFSSFDDSY